ncbi:MAG: hypothetical protein JWQ71_1858 [Pedosphaera sp.]|nr:hypothetical protein [Pedosphaera sp.]
MAYALKPILSKLKKTPFNFALIEGKKNDMVLVTPKPAPGKLLDDTKKDCGDGKRIAKGICMKEDGQIIFATRGAPMPAWKTAVKKIFQEQKCSMFLPVEFRQLGANESEEVVTEEPTDESDETASESEEATETTTEPETVSQTPTATSTQSTSTAPKPSAPIPKTPALSPTEAAATFNSRIKALQSPVMFAGIKTPTLKAPLAKLMAEAKALGEKKDFNNGLKKLDEVDALIPKAPPKAATPPPKPERTEADFVKLFDRATKTIAYAKKNEADEAVRILKRVKEELTQMDSDLRNVPGGALRPKVGAALQDIATTIDTLEKQAAEEVLLECRKWLQQSQTLLKKPTEAEQTPEGERVRAGKLLHYITDVTKGIPRGEGLLARLSITSLKGELDKVKETLPLARRQWELLCPQRTTKKPPGDAPPVTRPAPAGVKDAAGWTSACDAVDVAVATGKEPSDTDVEKMLNGAQEALDANKDWKWEADLKTKFGGSWEAVKAHYKTMPDRAKAKEFMSGYWWFRKTVVDREMRKLATALKFEWESVGSTNLESDYDISVKTHGMFGKVKVWDWEIVERFNKTISSRFGGVQPGTLFDTNLYADALPPELKREGEKTATEKDMDAMSEKGQDIGALMKMRRYMDWDDYVAHQDGIVGELKKALAAEKDQAKKKLLQQRTNTTQEQFELADSLYFLKLTKLLQTAKVPGVERLADSPSGQKKLIEMVEELEHDPDKLMAATNSAYVDAMKEVRDIEALLAEKDAQLKPLEGKTDEPSVAKRTKLLEERAGVLARCQSVMSDATFFAAEAYHSRGPINHIVKAGQKSAQEVKAKGLAPSEQGRLTAEKLQLLPLTGFMQSFNEQVGDFLKDAKHYEEKSPFPGLGFYRSSKYLERVCDSMEWISKKLEQSGSEAAKEFSAITIAGKKPEALKPSLKPLTDLRGGKKDFTGLADPQQETEAYSMEVVQSIFGPSVKTLRDLAGIVKKTSLEVNKVLRKADVGQQLVAQDDKAYFTGAR